MKIAIFLNDCDAQKSPYFRNMDFRNPQLGNPGIGGTEYEYVMLAYALANFSSCEVNLYCRERSNIYPDGVNVHIFGELSELVEQVKADGNDILVMRLDAYHNLLEVFDITRDSGLNIVAWSHCFMSQELIDMAAEHPAIKRIVMVSHEHYDYHFDHPAIAKSTYIYNMVDGRHFPLREYPAEPAVTFTGGLYRPKGFHVLAAMWKDILREVPGAKLYVIGSGKLYNRNSQLGAYGLADAEYEAEFMKYLTEDGKILPSVKFLGNMGVEKAEIYSKTTVGVVNPTGISETFCISAPDTEACGVPVVTRAYGGLFETVKHGETGYLCRNAEEIKKYIVLLLKDKELNIRLGRQAKDFVEEAFLPEKIVKQWVKLFDDILNNRPCDYIPHSKHYTLLKRLIIANRWLHDHHIHTPAATAFARQNRQKFVRNIKQGLIGIIGKLFKRS